MDAELDQTFLDWIRSKPHLVKEESLMYEAFVLGVNTYKNKAKEKNKELMEKSRKILENAEEEREQIWLNSLKNIRKEEEDAKKH